MSKKNAIMQNLDLSLYNMKGDKKLYINYYDALERCSLMRFSEKYGEFE